MKSKVKCDNCENVSIVLDVPVAELRYSEVDIYFFCKVCKVEFCKTFCLLPKGN